MSEVNSRPRAGFAVLVAAGILLSRITGLLVLSDWCLGVLNSHRKFFLSYVAPVFWNAAMIATLIFFGGGSTQSRLAIALAWGTVLGSALQFGIQVPFVLRYAPRIRLSLQTALAPVREVIRASARAVAGAAGCHLTGYMVRSMPVGLATRGVSGLATGRT